MSTKLKQPVGPEALRRLSWIVVISGVILVALLGRISTSRLLGMPFWFPDSMSYVRPALESPLLPFSQFRTIGFPALLSVALNLGDHPQVVLFLHHLLWLVSTVALVTATWLRLQSPGSALAIAWWLSYCQKALAFELGVMSEHITRGLITTVTALLLLWWGRPTVLRATIVGGLVGVGALVRPTVISLLPVVAVWLIVDLSERSKVQRSRLILLGASGVAMTVVMAPAVAAFWIRYGHPAVSDWGSIALYAHVVHLTDLEDPDYPELTRELKPIVEPLSALSLGGRRYVGDWAIFGTVPEWAPDDTSIPRSTWDIITEHARKDRSSEPLLTRTSRIYGALARRAIITHPGGYIAHATRSFVRMWAEGMGVRYPHPDVTIERHSLSVAHWAAAYRELGRPTPPLRGAYRSDYQLGSAMYAAGRAFRWLTTRTTWLLHRFGGFAWVPIAVWTFAVVSWPRARQTARDSLVAVGVCTVVTVSWMAIHALVLVSESLRLMVPVQDAVALVPVAATHGVIAILWNQRRQAV